MTRFPSLSSSKPPSRRRCRWKSPNPRSTWAISTPRRPCKHYGERSPQGAAHLIELATALEEASEPRRALLAWERVMDLTKPDETQAATAISSIKRLRPTLPDWNPKPETAIAITLHASTGKKLAKSLHARP